jgi:hypothetical protein
VRGPADARAELKPEEVLDLLPDRQREEDGQTEQQGDGGEEADRSPTPCAAPLGARAATCAFLAVGALDG